MARMFPHVQLVTFDPVWVDWPAPPRSACFGPRCQGGSLRRASLPTVLYMVVLRSRSVTQHHLRA